MWNARCLTRRGLTIVEIMVVLAIIASITGMGLAAFSSTGAADLRRDASRLSTVIRFTYSNAALTNSRYRLVFDIDNHSYGTEVQEYGLTVSDSDEDTEEFMTQEAREVGRQADREKDLYDEEEGGFGLNRRITNDQVDEGVVDQVRLSAGIHFEKILTTYRREPYTDGQAAMTFSPGGLQDQVLITLANEDGGQIVLLTEPMTGRVLTFTDPREIPDGFGEVERENE